MNVKFIYNIQNELCHLKETVDDREFFEKFDYQIFFPKGVNFDNFNNFNNKQLSQMVKPEMDKKLINDAKKAFKDIFLPNKATIIDFLDSLPGKRQNTYEIIFTKYGVGGSYYYPNKIIINLQYQFDTCETFIHEAVHLSIEKTIIQKYNLSFEEKESIVDWLIFENEKMHQILLNYTNQNDFGKPSNDLLARVGLIK